MKILAIETSCDETAVALLEATGSLKNPRFRVLGNSLISQIDIHKPYGGVYPTLAKREHQKNLPPLLHKTLSEAGENPDDPDIDFIAVTEGPGLEPALWVGIAFANELAKKWHKPVLPINHMEGHIYSVLFQKENARLTFPALALLVSGGHTELVLIKNFGQYQIIGKTRDDAVGEAFDKVARILGLPYPGGPQISRLAEAARSRKTETDFQFPRPMINANNLDFSYSGLKTAVLYKVQKLDEINESLKSKIARAFEDAAIEVLISKTKRAIDGAKIPIRTLIAAGGVIANKYLRSELLRVVRDYDGLKLLLPESNLTTDNAIMIGIASYIRALSNPESFNKKREIKARGNLSL